MAEGETGQEAQEIKNWARRIKYTLLETGKFGSLREIGLTDLRDILLFMIEYPSWKLGYKAAARKQTYIDQVNWL